MELKNIILLTVFAVLAVNTVFGQDPVPKYPDIGTTYSTYLSMNENIYGYTIAMKEYHSMSKNTSRFEGENIIIADWASQEMLYWNASTYISNMDSECLVDREILKNGFPLKPTYQWFSKSKENAVFIETKTLSDRNIKCDIFGHVATEQKDQPETTCGQQAILSSIVADELKTYKDTENNDCSISYEGDVTVKCSELGDVSTCIFTYTEKVGPEPTEKPTDPPIPTDPSTPTDPPIPTDPSTPTDPPTPTNPSTPTDPPIPTDPSTPTDPNPPENLRKLLSIDEEEPEVSPKIKTCTRSTKYDITKLGTLSEGKTPENFPCVSNIFKTYTFYFDAATTIPIRFTLVTLTQTLPKLENVTTSDVVVDLVDWVNDESQQDSLYAHQSTCAEKSIQHSWNIPTSKPDEKPTAYILDISHFSALFEPVLGGELQESFEWKFDLANRFQSFEFDRPGGDILHIINDEQNTDFIVNTLTMECQFPGENKSPVFIGDRKSVVYKALIESSNSQWVLGEKTKLRNVDVYPWTSKIGNFDVTVNTFAPGWAFPGRVGVDKTTTVPHSVHVQFTEETKTVIDVWDIYLFVRSYIPQRYQSALNIGCAPVLPIQYTSLVSIDDLTQGHTISFFEQHDKVKDFTLTQGKFKDYNTKTLLNSKNLLQWNVTSCSSFEKAALLTSSVALDVYDSSLFYYFNLIKDKPMQFIGNSSLVRSPNAKSWKRETGNMVDVDGNISSTEVTFYWAPSKNSSLPISQITSSYTPVRVFVETRNTPKGSDTTLIHRTVIDWANFNATVSEEQVASPTCAANADSTPYTNVESSVVYAKPTLDNSTTRALLPSNFTAYFEIKTKVDGETKTNYVLWEFSRDRLAESITYFYENGSSAVYSYCYFSNMGGQGNFSLNNVSKGVANTQSSPLYGADGSLVNFFNNVDYLKLAVLDTNYQTIRSVSSERWFINSTTKNSIASINWYPANWTFNNVDPSTVRVPIRLTRTNGTDSSNVVETWDIFRFSTTISPELYSKCVPNVTVKSGKSISKGATIAIIIIVAVFAAGMVALAITIIKKRGGISRKQPPHILLDDRNLINQSDNERLYEN